MSVSNRKTGLALCLLVFASAGCSQPGEALGPTADVEAAAEIRTILFGQPVDQTDEIEETEDIAAGRGQSPPAEFRLNMPMLIENEITPVQQQGIADTLVALFGTPNSPHVPNGSQLDRRKLAMAAGSVRSAEDGTKHGLYRQHCAHCHGISGDGRGPTALFLDPYPRDFRSGLFKFKGTARAAMPSDEDLRQILMEGMPGTAMPSFQLLATDKIEALIEYVKYLSVRGQTEIALAQFANDEMYDDDDEPLPFDFHDDELDLANIVRELDAENAEKWIATADATIRPDVDAIPKSERTTEELEQSIAAGRELFYGSKANCVKCHGPIALGDGQTDDWNDWNKETKEFLENTDRLASTLEERAGGMENDELAAAKATLVSRQAIVETMFPVRKIRPRDLRESVYRGGRRPLDLFWRVHEGVNGTPMPGFGGTLTEEEIWQIVDYTRSLPYEPASRPQKPLQAVVRERF